MKQILASFSKGVLILLKIGVALTVLSGRWGLTICKEPVDFEILLEQEPKKVLDLLLWLLSG